MTFLLTTMALLAGAPAEAADGLAMAPSFVQAEPPVAAADGAARSLRRGVSRAHAFTGWRDQFEDEAMQEAWCLLLEHHPEVVLMSDDEIRESRVSITRRDGRVVELPLELRLVELGIKARNTVLRDNHLNRQSMGQRVGFADFEDGVGYRLRVLGKKTPTAGPSHT